MIGGAATEAITLWLEPIRSFLDPPCPSDWRGLHAVAAALDHALMTHPVGPEVTPGEERSRRLRAIRRELADNIDTAFQSTAAQLLTQFVCGYRDLDLRDATGLGHGQLIARRAHPSTRRHWVPRLRAGELAGIAVTEPHGGSRVAVTRTQAIPAPDGTWLVTGRKTWISRLVEAAVFVVFFRAPTGRIAAAAIDATAPGLRREQIPRRA
jgi:alkylation response protein AidB-like acyl-CoA dehydrogenase